MFAFDRANARHACVSTSWARFLLWDFSSSHAFSSFGPGIPIWVEHIFFGQRPGPVCQGNCRELTTLWVARLDDSAELKVTDPKEQQRDVEEEETKGEERWDGVDCGGRRAECC